MRGRIVVLSGPSGVGKDTVIEAWREADPRVERVVACTTRDRRKGERDGVDYRFLSSRDFEAMQAAGGFLESKLVHGAWYGTPRAAMDAILESGGIAVLKIDVQGAEEVRKLRPDALLVFLAPPSMEELERRLRSRGTETDEKVRERLRNAAAEMERAEGYDAVVVNDTVEGAVAALQEAAGG